MRDPINAHPGARDKGPAKDRKAQIRNGKRGELLAYTRRPNLIPLLDEKNNITKDIANGTAVNIVTMVFGIMGDDSATGVVFTRNGHNGKKEMEGEYLINAQ